MVHLAYGEQGLFGAVILSCGRGWDANCDRLMITLAQPDFQLIE